jgi:SAM-dependent methyltransferase
MENANIAYASGEIARYYNSNRVTWQQFYESERRIIERLGLGPDSEVLDIGCGCGGLGLALRERFGAHRYTGVEINREAAEAGQALNAQARMLDGDILEIGRGALQGEQFDVVFSLSCVDWNVRFADMLQAAWGFVRPGGQLVATFRLTEGEGCSDFERSYQYINFDGAHEGERAAYVVLNADNLLRRLARFDPASIDAYGYWGSPSASAVTPYTRLCFSAFSVRKRKSGETPPLRRDLTLPQELLATLDLR